MLYILIAYAAWPVHGSISYARSLAHHLGRDDLKVVSQSWLEPMNWRGLELTGIVLDHETSRRMDAREWEWYHEARSRIRQKIHSN